MNKISKRLNVIKSLVDEKIVCDVGCDHGKLAKALIDEKLVDFIYISDISKPSLHKAEILLGDYDNFKSIHCDGLLGYNGLNIDECIISGMGGDEIINIIKLSPIKINKFILSPQHNIVGLKKFMINNGYKITDDIIIKDKNKFYNIIKFILGKSDYPSEFELYFGKINNQSKYSDLDEYVNFEYNKVSRIINNNSNVSIELIKYYDLLKEFKKRINI